MKEKMVHMQEYSRNSRRKSFIKLGENIFTQPLPHPLLASYTCRFYNLSTVDNFRILRAVGKIEFSHLSGDKTGKGKEEREEYYDSSAI